MMLANNFFFFLLYTNSSIHYKLQTFPQLNALALQPENNRMDVGEEKINKHPI